MGILLMVGRFFLNPKVILVVLVLGVISGIEYKVYQAGADSKIEWANKQIDAVKAELKNANNEITQLKDQREKEIAANNLAVEQGKKAQDKIVQDLTKKLAAAKVEKQKVQIVEKEIVKYVTPQDDARCVINAGFVWVHDLPLHPELSNSPPGNPESASGVTLSDVAATDAANLAECTERGQVIDAWQFWYKQNKAAFDKIKQESVK